MQSLADGKRAPKLAARSLTQRLRKFLKPVRSRLGSPDYGGAFQECSKQKDVHGCGPRCRALNRSS